MKQLLCMLILLPFSLSLMAKINLPSDCNEYQEVTKSDFVLIHKKEFIQLGECIGRAHLKTRTIDWLSDSCSEIPEDKNNPLGILSLSKIEAIKIGMCLGVINAIYTRYDDAYVYQQHRRYNSYRSSHRKYSCMKGEPAIQRLMKLVDTRVNRDEIRDELCKQV